MGDSDAEWVGVDFEFGNPDQPRTTPRPVTRRPVTRRPFTERPAPRIPNPHDAPEVEGPAGKPPSVTVISLAVGGVLGVVLLMLLVYMLVLRKRLNKAKVASTDSQYQLRVEDVAHLSHLDETSNTYVNTTDLQKLLSSVRAKNKGEERPPTMPKIQHQTPTPYRSTSDTKPHSTGGQSDNTSFISDPDVVVVRAPMPVPYNKTDLHDTCNPEAKWQPKPVPQTEALYSNIEPTEPFTLSKPPSRKKGGAPATAPPPPPAKQKKNPADNCIVNEASVSPTVIARPAPPPPALAKTKSVEAVDPPQIQKPLVPGGTKPTPPVAPKPNKNTPVATVQKPAPPAFSKPTPPSTYKPTPPPTNKPSPPPAKKPSPPPANKPSPPTFKPAPPVASKPGVANKGKGLPPLKMALLPSRSKTSLDNCSTPDTGIIELTPENTPTPGTGSISSKIAFLEGKMKTPVLPTRALPQKT